MLYNYITMRNAKKRKIIIMYYRIENAAVVPKLKIRPTNHANRSVKLCKRFAFIQFKVDPFLANLNNLHLINEKEY